MKISFHGACQEVTGSCVLIETGTTKFLVDCGIFQGQDFYLEKNLTPFDFDVKKIDFVLLTHAHIDHCGRLPKLYREGFRGKVYATSPTCDFAEIMLLDSAKVIKREAEKKRKKPLYSEDDVFSLMRYFKPVAYNQKVRIGRDLTIRLKEAGHILGSAIFEVWIKEKGEKKKLVFSGDLGNPPAPIINNPKYISEADYVFIESTYGNRVHEPKALRKKLLKEAILGSIGRGGTLMIPAFALERTQEVLYELNNLVETKKIPAVPIFVDSPLAIKATAVYKKYAGMFDRESRRLIESGDDLFNFSGLEYTYTVEQSKTINTTNPPKVILAGSGMCNGGRMPYHLKFNLPDPNSHLLIISYQAKGSLGREIFDGARSVKIDGEKIRVRARVSAIGSYSSHADQPTLLKWLGRFKRKNLKKVFITHGEEETIGEFSRLVEKKIKIETIIAEYNKIYKL